jgi:hypothetical protein
MLLAAMAIGLSMRADRVVTFRCGNPIDAQVEPAHGAPWELDEATASIQSSAGLVVVLKAHSQEVDDHLCSTNYTLEELVPSGGRKFQSSSHSGYISVRDRTITIRIDGFNPDGNLVYFLEVETGKSPVLWAEEFDLFTGEHRFFHDGAFLLRYIQPECISTLHFAGLSSDNRFVVATSQDHDCPTTQFWELSAISTRSQIPSSSPYAPPTRIDSLQGVSSLDPGTVIPR